MSLHRKSARLLGLSAAKSALEVQNPDELMQAGATFRSRLCSMTYTFWFIGPF